MRRLLIFLAIVVVLVIAGDSLVRGLAERRAATELQNAFSLSEKPSVAIGGWPFFVRALLQSFPSVEVTGRDVAIEGLTVTSFSLRLRDVELPLSQLLGGAPSLEIGSGRGSIRMTSDLISERLGAQDLPFEFSIDGDQATVSSPELGGSVSADITLAGRSLTIAPPGVDPISIDLPRVADEVEYRSVRISGDAIIATFGVRRGTIVLED